MVRFVLRVCTVVLILGLSVPPLGSVSAQSATCSSFDTWIWAQAHFDRDKEGNAALDPDKNGIACEELSVAGFAPAIWADGIPEGLTPATVVSVTDGDTIRVQLPDGTVETVRLLHIDTPETSGTIGQCGGDEATWFLDWILGYAKGGTVYLEVDVTERDRYDRLLAHVWFEVDGDPNPYMAKDAMVLAGWAESQTFKPDVKYKEQLDASETFSVEHVTGVRLKCGKFGQPANDAGPSNEQIRQAWLKQPNQGQLPPFPGTQVAGSEQPAPQPQAQAETTENTGTTQPTDTSQPSQPSAPPAPVDAATETPSEAPPTGIPGTAEPATEYPTEVPPPTEEPVYIPPTEAPVIVQPTEVPVANCEPAYPDFCIPPVWQVGDLDCGDVGGGWFTVYPPDPHNFDGDFDGVGCEGG